jgi:hypothetical protein
MDYDSESNRTRYVQALYHMTFIADLQKGELVPYRARMHENFHGKDSEWLVLRSEGQRLEAHQFQMSGEDEVCIQLPGMQCV